MRTEALDDWLEDWFDANPGCITWPGAPVEPPEPVNEEPLLFRVARALAGTGGKIMTADEIADDVYGDECGRGGPGDPRNTIHQSIWALRHRHGVPIVCHGQRGYSLSRGWLLEATREHN